MGSNKKDKIQVSFIGTNASEVTGSCIWIKTPTRQILLELGLHQSTGNTLENYRTNNKHFEFKTKDIDYLFVGHTHSDHIALSPLLYKRGGNAKIIAPKGTYPLAEIILNDCANILEVEAKELSGKLNRDYSPIYDLTDVKKTMRYYNEYPMNQIIELDKEVKFRFTPSGHILNSAQIELWITVGNLTKKIVYTSDLGNVHIEKYYTNRLEQINKADLFISESTYAGRNEQIANKKMRQKDLEKIESAIRQTLDQKGRILIPVFAQDRAQNMLTILYDIFGKDKSFTTTVLLDSPMAVRMCRAYSELLEGEEAKKWEKVLQWENLKLVSDPVESKGYRDGKNPVVVLASSGMITKGRSLPWTASFLPRSQDRIITCGYAPKDSIAGIIKEGKQKTITICGKRVSNKCQITNLYSFTSHIQYDSLLDYLSNVEATKIVLVHGEMENKISFAKEVQKQLHKHDLTTKIVASDNDYQINI